MQRMQVQVPKCGNNVYTYMPCQAARSQQAHGWLGASEM